MTARRVTANLPADLLDAAMEVTGKGITDTLIDGLLRASLVELLQDLPLHDCPFTHWIRVGELRQSLAKKGVTVSTPDAHIAQCALDRGSLLLSRDAVFTRIARSRTLRVRLR